VAANVRVILPNIQHIPCGEALLLGAPVGDEKSVDAVLNGKLVVRKCLASRLMSLNAQDALFLLKKCFSTPKLSFILRYAACYTSPVLPDYDSVIQQTLRVVLNVNLTETVCSQATLPVSSGGLGVRPAMDLALPTFLSSVNGSAALALQLLTSRFHVSLGIQDPWQSTSQHLWKGGLVAEQQFQNRLGRASRRRGTCRW
jgi:hypothetical protein